MTVAGHRHERVAEEIAHELGAMLAGELKDPRLEASMTITEVRVSPDMKQARIFISVTGDDVETKRVIAGLEAACGFIRHELTERLQLRKMPELRFVLDRSEEYGNRIEELLRETKKPPEA